MKKVIVASATLGIGLLPACKNSQNTVEVVEEKRPNILFCIADDMSWQHTGYMGYNAVKTPTFDKLASGGVVFRNAYCNAPSCSASRASILTGRNAYELENAACLWSMVPSKFKVYQDILEENGYFIGFTGKGWGPGDIEDAGRTRNPAGNSFKSIRNLPFQDLGNDGAIWDVDYAANFKQFLSEKPDTAPFSFWAGILEPHRGYCRGIGERSGINLDSIVVPGFLPDTRAVRSDIADYLFEIQWYDEQVGRMLDVLDSIGELDNTIVVITSDNGMPFPRAKCTLYEYGTRMPLIVSWAGKIKQAREVDDFVSLIDMAPTFLEAAGLEVPGYMTGKSIMKTLLSDKDGMVDPGRNRVFTCKERHTICREDNKCYAQRAMRKDSLVLIWNMQPNLWPAGSPDPAMNWEYAPWGDIDNGPTKDAIMDQNADYDKDYLELAVGKRPEFELYNVEKDVFQLQNLAMLPEYQPVLEQYTKELKAYLAETKDPRIVSDGEVFREATFYGPVWYKSGMMLLKHFQNASKEEREKEKERIIKKLNIKEKDLNRFEGI